MVGPKLNIKFKDALKLVMKQSWLGMILGIGLSLYSGHLRGRYTQSVRCQEKMSQLFIVSINYLLLRRQTMTP